MRARTRWSAGSLAGKIKSVTLQPDGSGLTKASITPATRVTSFSSLAGYIGPSVFGLAAAKLISIGHIVAVLWLTLLLLVALLITVRNFFALCVVLVTGLLLYLCARQASVGAQTVLAYVITWFLLLSGLRVVLRYNGGRKVTRATWLRALTCPLGCGLGSGSWAPRCLLVAGARLLLDSAAAGRGSRAAGRDDWLRGSAPGICRTARSQASIHRRHRSDYRHRDVN